MAIPNKRFEFLNKETNIGVSDFISVKDSAIRNITENDVIEVSDGLTDMMVSLDQAMQENKDIAFASIEDSIKDMNPNMDLGDYDLKGLFRETKDVLGLMGDMSRMPDKLMDGMLSGMFPGNNNAKILAKSVFKLCDTMGRGMGRMKPFDVDINCGNGNLKGSKGNCRPSGISGLLSALTGGALGKGMDGINGLINAIVIMATSAYKANVCGGFSGSLGSLNGNMSAINRAGTMVIAGLSDMHGVKGILDVINNTNSFDVGLQYPDSVKSLIGKPNIPNDNNDVSKYLTQFGTDIRDINNICLGITDGASLLNDNWNKSSTGDISLANVVNSDLNSLNANNGYKALATNKLNNNSIGISSLNTINNDPIDSFNIAYVSLV